MGYYTGTSGDDSFTGTYGYDTFELGQGGADTARGGGGGDSFNMGAALSVDDRLDGGTGYDYVYLQGDYSAGLKLAAATLVNIEGFQFQGGFDYDITLADATNSSLGGMSVDGSDLGAGDHLYFNGSRETSSAFYMSGGAGDDRLVGGGGSDNFYLSNGGSDIVAGGGGVDAFYCVDMLDANDRVNGGDGYDFLYLEGDYNLTFRPSTVTFVEEIYLAHGHDYRLRLSDGTVAAGQVMRINGYQLTGAHKVLLDGSRELDGSLQLSGAEGRDTLIGGAGDDNLSGNAGGDFLQGNDGDDFLWGGSGHDEMTAGAGQDTFYFQDLESPAANPDLITDLALSDVVDLSRIDADTTLANDQQFTLVSHFTGHAGQLDLLYDSAAGVTHIMMDTDGDGAADQVIDATGNHAGFTQFVL